MTPLAVQDLWERLHLGLDRGGDLLTAEEHGLVEEVLSLRGEPALLLARLSARRPVAFRLDGMTVAGVEDVPGAAQALVDAGLASYEVDWASRLGVATRPVLAAGCARLGLPRTGRRDQLVDRLIGAEGWDDARWLRLTVDRLLLRLERFATLRLDVDRSAEVLERLGHRRWWPYALTSGRALLPDRERLLAWEALAEGLEALDLDGCLQALSAPDWPPGGLDLRRPLVRRVRELVVQAAREGADHDVERGASGLAELGLLGPEVLRRWVRVLEASGRSLEAYERLRSLHEAASGAERIAFARTGRRLARSLGRAWIPDPPLAPPAQRTVQLGRVDGDTTRPRYDTGEGGAVVEGAVASRIEQAGRHVLRGDGGVWRTLTSLLLADASFLPVPGQLPVPRLAGPLDRGTPAFAARRAAALFALWDALREGGGPRLVAEAWDRYEGHEVAGVRWDEHGRDALVAVAEGLGPDGLCALLRPLLARGRRARQGLPDLLVLPGPVVRLEGVHPSRLDAALHLVEVKGEADQVRDGQLAWFDRLGRAGVRMELWRVIPPPS